MLHEVTGGTVEMLDENRVVCKSIGAGQLKAQIFQAEFLPNSVLELRKRAFPLAKHVVDQFDECALHVVVVNDAEPNKAIGALRMICDEESLEDGFYTETEFDLSALIKLPGKRLEISRVTVDPSTQNLGVLYQLFSATFGHPAFLSASYVFGVASYLSRDFEAVHHDIASLLCSHKIDEDWCPKARSSNPYCGNTHKVKTNQQNQIRPPLITAFLRAGAKVGDGAYWDEDFGAIDVAMVLDRSEKVR